MTNHLIPNNKCIVGFITYKVKCRSKKKKKHKIGEK